MTPDRAKARLDLRTAARLIETAAARIPDDVILCPTCKVKHYTSFEVHVAKEKVKGALTRIYDALSLLKKAEAKERGEEEAAAQTETEKPEVNDGP